MLYFKLSTLSYIESLRSDHSSCCDSFKSENKKYRTQALTKMNHTVGLNPKSKINLLTFNSRLFAERHSFVALPLPNTFYECHLPTVYSVSVRYLILSVSSPHRFTHFPEFVLDPLRHAEQE